MSKPVKVLMVCLGNICRSPTAEGVLRSKAMQAGLSELVFVDSAGTSDWHAGEAPDARALRAAAARSYDLSSQRARQIKAQDFTDFDYILAMDHHNLRDLQRYCPQPLQHKISLFLSYGSLNVEEVPDPYDLGREAFDEVLDLVENASTGLLSSLIAKHELLR